jgi:SulP family sulfate permease
MRYKSFPIGSEKRAARFSCCGAREQPARMMEQAEFVRHLGTENILPHVEAALNRAREVNTSFEGLGKEIAADLQHAAL